MNNKYRSLEEMKELAKAFNLTPEEFLYECLSSCVKCLDRITEYINNENNQYINLSDIRNVINNTTL